MRVKRITAPQSLPVSVVEAKAHLNIDDDDHDIEISDMIGRATDYIDGIHGIGVCLVSQVWEMALDSFPTEIALPLYPLISVDSITYLDIDGQEQTVATSVYRVDDYSNPPKITLEWGETWPTARMVNSSIKVRFTAGHTSVPAQLKAAILLLVGHWFENREATIAGTIIAELPLSVEAILNNYRVTGAI